MQTKLLLQNYGAGWLHYFDWITTTNFITYHIAINIHLFIYCSFLDISYVSVL